MSPHQKNNNPPFDFEKAINAWKRKLHSRQALQDGDIAELEGYLRDKIEDLITQEMSKKDAFRMAVSEFDELDKLDTDYYFSRSPSAFRRRPSWQTPRFVPALVWNYFKVVARKFQKQRSYSVINLVGLTVGMAAFLVIFLYCNFECSYDNFHRNGNSIYRVQNDRITTAIHDKSAGCPPGLAPAMIEEFPEVKDAVRILNASGDSNVVSRNVLKEGDSESGAADQSVSFYERRIFFVDPSFLQIFSFPLISGNQETALQGPSSLVLSESAASKYFGHQDPLNQFLTVTTQFGKQDYKVAGVFRDLPANSHLQFDLLIPYEGLMVIWPSLEQQPWSSNAFLTYILLSPTADPQSLEAKFPGLIESYGLESTQLKREFHLQSLRSIHLTSRLRLEAEVNGDIKIVVFLEIIGFFILIIAWINSINLATARSHHRGKEVCVRKTLGAGRGQLARQFLFESVIYSVLSFGLAAGLVSTILPLFNRIVDRPLVLAHLGFGWIWIGLSILAGAILAGLYPAIVLSSFQPVIALRGLGVGISHGAVLRKGLVLFQFTLAVLLIASTLTVAKQLSFIRNRDLGANIDQILVLKVPSANDVEQQALLARNRLVGQASIMDSAVSSSIPGRDYSNSIGDIRRQNVSPEDLQALFVIDIDNGYFDLFNIPLIAGRSFDRDLGSERTTVILNEEAVNLLGFEGPEEAIGQNIVLGGFRTEAVQVVGVAKNYNHKSLRYKIEPVIYMPLPYSIFSGRTYLSLKINGASSQAVLASIRSTWKEIFPGQPFEYSFLDDDFNRQYDEERRFGQIFGLSSFVAVFISCLGLFGLATFSADMRTKEIGIRKVFGGSSTEIAAMLAGEFMRWVILANLIAWPIAWIVMSRWLSRFAYRTTVGLWTLILSALLTLFIALVTVAGKSIKTALANPVDSIRYE